MARRADPRDPIRRLRAVLLELADRDNGVPPCANPVDVATIALGIANQVGTDLDSPELVDLIYAAWLFYETRLSADPLSPGALAIIADWRADDVAAKAER